MATFPYVPLLENKTGLLYLSNNNTLTYSLQSGVDGDVLLGQGGLSFSSVPDPRINLVRQSGKFIMTYSGGLWDSATADYVPFTLVSKDVAFSKGSGASQILDIYRETPGPQAGELDVNRERTGGSDLTFYVWTLGWPEVASISPTFIPADGTAHNVTISLKRRLHSTQNPSVAFSQTGSGGTVSFGEAVAVRNNNGQIIGYTTTATAAAGQETATLSVAMTANETVTYLKDDAIVTESVVYNDGTTEVATLQINKVVVAVPPTIGSNGLIAGVSGEDTYIGTISPFWASAFPDGTTGFFTNGLTALLTAYSSGTTLGRLEIVAKQWGLSDSLIVGTAEAPTSSENVTINGTSVTQKDYRVNFDTQLFLNAAVKWDIGYKLYDTANTVVLSGWYGTYYNGNLTNNVSAYTVYVVTSGTNSTTYKWTLGTGWTDNSGTPATPKFNGKVTVYLSESWNLANRNNGNGIMPGGGIPWDLFTLTIGSHHITITNAAEQRVNVAPAGGQADYACVGYELDTTNTTWFPSGNGAYTMTMTLTSIEQTANKRPNIEFDIPLTVDNTVVITTAADFSISATPVSIDYPITYVNDYYATGQFVYSGPEWVYIRVTTSAVGGYAGSVTFGVDGLPVGANAIFTVPSGNFTATSNEGPTTQLRINAIECALGIYPLTITATSNGKVKSTNVNLNIGFASANSPYINYFTPSTNILTAGSSVDLYCDFSPDDAVAEVSDDRGNKWSVINHQTLTVGDVNQNTTFTLTVSNPVGTTNKLATVTAYGMPSISNFSITPTSGSAGTSFSLSAIYSNGVGTVDKGVGAIKSDGTLISTGPLQSATTFTLTVTNAYGSVTKQVSASVGSVPLIDSFTADQNYVPYGNSTVLIPVFSNADYAWVDNGIGAVTSGVAFSSGAILDTTSFTLHVINTSGEVTQSLTIANTTTTSGTPPIITGFTASSSQVQAGGTVTLYPVFSGTGVTASIDAIGAVTSGQSYTTPVINSTRVFTLTATNTYGSVSQSVTISVPTGGGGLSGGGTDVVVGCVPAGTLVLMAEGFAPIETVQVGQLAMGYDEHSMLPMVSEITNVFKYPNHQLYEIDTNEGTLVCSDDHRLAVLNYGDGTYSYPSVRKLAKNDVVLTLRPDNSLAPATVLNVLPLSQFEDVYHLTLADGHVFVAGGFAAHNKNKAASDTQSYPAGFIN